MAKQQLYTNNEFIVKQSTGSNILIGTVFLIIAFLMFINIANETNPSYFLVLFMLIPAISFFVKAFNPQNIIKVNKEGFYHYNILKTNWDNFISAESREEQRDSDLEYQFVFVIRFYQPGEGTFELKIIMRNTFNRSGEEVIKAINHFRNPPLK